MKSRISTYVLGAILAAGLIAWISGKSHPRPQTIFKFLGYTNSGNQTEALFRLDYPPQHVLSDGLYELRYNSSTGWARPTAPTVSWRFFGWDGTGCVAAVSVETTNMPARVVMFSLVRRAGFAGLCDRALDSWEEWRGSLSLQRGTAIYLTNETVTATSTR